MKGGSQWVFEGEGERERGKREEEVSQFKRLRSGEIVALDMLEFACTLW